MGSTSSDLIKMSQKSESIAEPAQRRGVGRESTIEKFTRRIAAIPVISIIIISILHHVSVSVIFFSILAFIRETLSVLYDYIASYVIDLSLLRFTEDSSQIPGYYAFRHSNLGSRFERDENSQ